ncbi:MAG: DUF1566 domain-containing protein [Cyclobacteriaceae bacterium]
MQFIVSFLLLLNWNVTSEISLETHSKANQKKYSIGEHVHGGIVFYIDPSGEHGLVAAPRDVKFQGKDRMVWGCQGATIRGARATALGSGDQNTKDIVQTCQKGETAADRCAKMTTNKYRDWYLPSKGELNTMYKMNRKAKLGLKKTGYWSSTGMGNGTAWVQTMGMGFQFVSAKFGAHKVRAVRKF